MKAFYNIFNTSYCSCLFVVDETLGKIRYVSLAADSNASSSNLYDPARDWAEKHKIELCEIPDNWKEDSTFKTTVQGLHKLVENPSSPVEFDYSLQGTDFQQNVWKYLTTIQAGTTVTYSDITEGLGLSQSTCRAVASAIGANKLALIIPCHRVIRRDGQLGGYRWGLELKKEILRREN